MITLSSPSIVPAVAIDLTQVTRLAAYPREAIYIVETAAGAKWAVPEIDYDTLEATLYGHPDACLVRMASGLMDTIWRVEWLQPRTTIAALEVIA